MCFCFLTLLVFENQILFVLAVIYINVYRFSSNLTTGKQTNKQTTFFLPFSSVYLSDPNKCVYCVYFLHGGAEYFSGFLILRAH